MTLVGVRCVPDTDFPWVPDAMACIVLLSFPVRHEHCLILPHNTLVDGHLSPPGHYGRLVLSGILSLRLSFCTVASKFGSTYMEGT
jgi:hypothetical protein